ncbi:CHAT domain-containing protein [Herbidospora cretacea]|uniref:CHAT domain-containing protein n=1 Tax=Herbidospora cretacea TaxID=28444 RepID=UPI0007741D02|nr:CHAT domain-containing tetratricopeptide repeat protein [Herbidospora cretacea]
MTTTQDPARAALMLAEADPGRAVEVAASVAATARDHHDLVALSRAERALGIAAVHLDDLATAARHLRAAIRTAGRAGSFELAAEARIRMAFVTSMRGRPRQALADLEALLPRLHGELRGRAEAQRAAIFNHLGRHADALASYRQAIPVLRRAQDHVWLQRVLSNRGIVYGYRQEFALAEADFHEAEELCADLGLDLSLAVVRLNLGWVRGVRGDVPGALRYLDLAETRFRELGTHQLGWLLSDRSELLLSVGLTAEARAAAEEAVGELRRRRRAIVLPEVRLLLARTATLDGDHERAVEAARRAAREFGAQQRPEWRVLASFVVLQSRLAAGHPGVTAARFETVARELLDAGWTAASVEARLLGARLAMAPGSDTRTALDLLSVAAGFRQRGPALLRVRGWQAEALRRLAVGDAAGASAAVRRGIRVLDEHRAALGATDLRAHSAGFRVELAELGLRMALDRGGPAHVLGWAEQGRASHLLMRRVRPPDDPWLAEKLTELRAVATDARTSRDPAVTDRQALLERHIRDYVRAQAGVPHGPEARRDAGVIRALAPLLADRALVEFVLLDGVLHAVTVIGGRARLTNLGAVGPVRDLIERVPFALRRLSRSGDTRGGSSAAARMLRHAAARLDALLLAPLGLGDRPLVIVPTGPLQGLPWPVLPSCEGRPVAVSPSAALWRAAVSRTRSGEGGRVVVAAGPGLPDAAAEVAEVAAIHRTVPVEGGAVEILAALDGARLAHLAAHGRVNTANPLFSSLHLADGPLTVYDLERLRTPPELVVLAACESGRSVVRAGDELLGLSTTFLSLGTRCVVASMVPVPDARTRPLMTALHERLSAGVPAATALAETQREAGDDTTAAGFVCIGADIAGHRSGGM